MSVVMTQTEPVELSVMTDDGAVDYPDVADVVEIQEGRLQIVTLDGESQLVDGWIFGVSPFTEADGQEWKMWLDTGRGLLRAEPVVGPMNLPHHIQFYYDGYRQTTGGRIKRLKRHDL